MFFNNVSKYEMILLTKLSVQNENFLKMNIIMHLFSDFIIEKLLFYTLGWYYKIYNVYYFNLHLLFCVQFQQWLQKEKKYFLLINYYKFIL